MRKIPFLGAVGSLLYGSYGTRVDITSCSISHLRTPHRTDRSTTASRPDLQLDTTGTELPFLRFLLNAALDVARNVAP